MGRVERLEVTALCKDPMSPTQNSCSSSPLAREYSFLVTASPDNSLGPLVPGLGPVQGTGVQTAEGSHYVNNINFSQN